MADACPRDTKPELSSATRIRARKHTTLHCNSHPCSTKHVKLSVSSQIAGIHGDLPPILGSVQFVPTMFAASTNSQTVEDAREDQLTNSSRSLESRAGSIQNQPCLPFRGKQGNVMSLVLPSSRIPVCCRQFLALNLCATLSGCELVCCD
jgi:hypothetical protein